MATSKKKDSVPQDAATVKETASVPHKGPLKTIRIDDCSVSLWRRERDVRGQMKTFWSLTFERSYVDKTGNRRYTGFFAPESCGKLITLCQQADEQIRMLQEEADQQDAA